MIVDPSIVNCVIYHGECSDGMGAAYAAWKLLGNKAEYIPCIHNGPIPDVSGKKVAVLDFSFKNKVTKELIEQASDFIIIDHHQSAMIELHDLGSYTRFDMNKSGAILAWEWFHPGKEPPKFLEYIQDRDLNKWIIPYSKEFSASFDMVPFEFSAYEEYEDDSVIDDAVKRGSYILAYSKTVIRKICEKASERKLKINDREFNILIVNSPHWRCEIGRALAKECDAAMIYYNDHNLMKTVVSLRSFHENVDVSELARYFGGGGHKKISKFSLEYGVNLEELFSEPEDEITDEVEYFGAD